MWSEGALISIRRGNRYCLYKQDCFCEISRRKIRGYVENQIRWIRSEHIDGTVGRRNDSHVRRNHLIVGVQDRRHRPRGAVLPKTEIP